MALSCGVCPRPAPSVPLRFQPVNGEGPVKASPIFPPRKTSAIVLFRQTFCLYRQETPVYDEYEYDRSDLRAAARAKGDTRPVDLERRLGVSASTAWRLWTGWAAPSAAVAVLVQAHYVLTTA